MVGATSADVHSWGPGDTVALTNGASVRITAVVADASVGAAELVVPTAGAAAAGIDTDRYVLVRPRGAADATAACPASDPGARTRNGERSSAAVTRRAVTVSP